MPSFPSVRALAIPCGALLLATAAAAQEPRQPDEVVDLVEHPERTVLAGQAFRAPLFGGVREQGRT